MTDEEVALWLERVQYLFVRRRRAAEAEDLGDLIASKVWAYSGDEVVGLLCEAVEIVKNLR